MPARPVLDAIGSNLTAVRATRNAKFPSPIFTPHPCCHRSHSRTSHGAGPKIEPPVNNMTTPSADNRERRLDEARQNNAVSIRSEPCNATYESEWKKYKDWVDENVDEEGLDSPKPYLTRFNVDMYFQLEVVNRAGARNHINRVKNALEWYAANQEYADSAAIFEVDSPDV